MSGWHVTPSKWQTCICGKVCKGRAAFTNHARKCAAEIARSEAFLARIKGSAWVERRTCGHCSDRVGPDNCCLNGCEGTS